jgi:hypothetical protein
MRDNVQAMGYAPLGHERTVCTSTNPTWWFNDVHAIVHGSNDIHADVK